MKTHFILRWPERAALVSFPPFAAAFVSVILLLTGTLSALGPHHVFFYGGWWWPAVIFGVGGIILPLIALPFAPGYEVSNGGKLIIKRKLGRVAPFIGVRLIVDLTVVHVIKGGWHLDVHLVDGNRFRLHASYFNRQTAERMKQAILRMRTMRSRQRAQIEPGNHTIPAAFDALD